MRQTALNLPDAAGGSAGSFQHLSRNALAIFLALALVLGGVVSPTFLSKGNISNLVLQWSPLAIVAIGQTFVIVVRGLDLSVASVMATAAVIATSFHGADSDIPAVVGLSMLISLAVGLLNGVLVTKRSVSPFLATLSTMILLQGFRFAYTQGAPSGHVPPLFRVFGSGNLYGVPYNFMIVLVIAAAFYVLLARSAFGRRVYIVGGNPVAATLVGINADRVTIAAYVISSLLACAAGLILSGYVGLVDNWVGQGFELELDRCGRHRRGRALRGPRNPRRRSGRSGRDSRHWQRGADVRPAGSASAHRQGARHRLGRGAVRATGELRGRFEMKAVRFYAKEDVRVEDVAAPIALGDSQVMVKPLTCGICGTDLHEFAGGPIVTPKTPHKFTGAVLPQILGHEFSAEIVDVGRSVKRLRKGDRISIQPLVMPLDDYYSRRGLNHLSPSMGCVGLSWAWGGMGISPSSTSTTRTSSPAT